MIVYQIKNLVNGKVYIGQTIQEGHQRWYEHKSSAKRGKHPLYNSMKKHGLDNFEFSVLDTAQTLEELNFKEKHYLDLARSNGEVYNLREAGNNKIHSEESKLRMSEAQKKAHERRRNNGGDGGWTRIDGGSMLGKAHPKKGKPGKKWSEETKARHSIIVKNRVKTKGKTWKLVDGKRVWMEKIK